MLYKRRQNINNLKKNYYTSSAGHYDTGYVQNLLTELACIWFRELRGSGWDRPTFLHVWWKTQVNGSAHLPEYSVKMLYQTTPQTSAINGGA